jgi:hypothetical protein
VALEEVWAVRVAAEVGEWADPRQQGRLATVYVLPVDTGSPMCAGFRACRGSARNVTP